MFIHKTICLSRLKYKHRIRASVNIFRNNLAAQPEQRVTSKKALVHLLIREVSHTAVFMEALNR